MRRTIMLSALILMSYLLMPGKAIAACITDGNAGCGTNDSLCCDGDCVANICTGLQANGHACDEDLDCKGGRCDDTTPPPPWTGSCGTKACCDSGTAGPCANDAACCEGFYCDNPGATGHCTTKWPSGHPCTAGNQCEAGTCPGGFCTVSGVGGLCNPPGNGGCGGPPLVCAHQCTSLLGWCCRAIGDGPCTVANQQTTCCTGHCNGVTSKCKL